MKKVVRSRQEVFGGNGRGGVIGERERLNRESILLQEEIDYLQKLVLAGHYPEIQKGIGKEIRNREKRINEIEEQLGYVNQADLL